MFCQHSEDSDQTKQMLIVGFPMECHKHYFHWPEFQPSSNVAVRGWGLNFIVCQFEDLAIQ